jgi:hypothetical protein
LLQGSPVAGTLVGQPAVPMHIHDKSMHAQPVSPLL